MNALLALLVTLLFAGAIVLAIGWLSGYRPLIFWLHPKRRIWLIMKDGEYVSSILETDPGGGLYAYREPIFRIGFVKLTEDGNASSSSYVERWERQ